MCPRRARCYVGRHRHWQLLAGAAGAQYLSAYRYRGHTYDAPAVNGYYLPPTLGGYNVYTPSYSYFSPAYGYAPFGGVGFGSYSAYGGFNPYGPYGGFSGNGWGWGGAF